VAPVQAQTQTGTPKVVALQQIGLARYLERSQIVRSSENYRLDIMSNDWWGEPLGAMLARVLIEELGQRLPQSTVIGETGAVSASPDATIELNVQRLDEDASGNLVMRAQASVRFKGRSEPVLRSFRFVVTPPAAGIEGEVNAISTPSASSPTASLRCSSVDEAVLCDPAHDRAQLRECAGCGLFQTVPALAPGATAQCARCPTVLRRTSAHRLDHIAALTLTAFILLVVMCSTPLMSVETAGISHIANLFSRPQELVRRNMAALGIVVLFVTALAPLARLTCTLYVLIRSHEGTPPRHLRAACSLWPRSSARGR
jgi:uncharacterized protein